MLRLIILILFKRVDLFFRVTGKIKGEKEEKRRSSFNLFFVAAN